MTGATAKRLAIAAVTVLLGVVAIGLLWSAYMVYDDEGYVLFSLREFATHGHLYTDVYTQYGPFFFVFYRGLHALGLVFTNTIGRELTLACWMGSTVLCGALVWRETRGSLVATIATLVGVFSHLWPMINEPSHPGGLITLLTAIAAWCGTHPRWSPAMRGAAIGAIVAMLVLTKINVGVFLGTSAAAWWLLRVPRWRRELQWAVGVGLAALPVALMFSHLDAAWVRVFALAAAAGAVSVVIACPQGRTMPWSGREVVAAFFAAITVTAVTVTVTLATGTTLAALLEGVVLGPLRHPSVYMLPFTWHAGALVIAAASVPLAIILALLPTERRFPVVTFGRIAVAGLYVAAGTGMLPMTSGGVVFSYGLALVWLFVIPLRDGESTTTARTWLALLFVLQALHAYPVAGSQVSWGTFLWFPLAALAFYDAPALVPSPSVRRLVLTGISAWAVFVFQYYASVAWDRLRGAEPLGLPGAESLRLQEWQASALRMLVDNSEAHGDVLFSLPGMLSFNLWTGLPTPTAANATHWFSLLSPTEQAAILQRLQDSPRAVLIRQRFVYDILARQHVIVHTPLLDWLLANYAPAFRVESYEFWIRKGRTIAALDSARVRPPDATRREYAIELIDRLPAGASIGSIELRYFMGNGSEPVITWTDANARIVTTSIGLDGTPLSNVAAPQPAKDRLVRIEITTTKYPRGFPPAMGIFYVRDRAGRRIAEARFED